MRHWSERYIGRPYVPGGFDCGELARLVQREVFGREIRVPTGRRYLAEETTAAKFRAMQEELRAGIPDCAERIAEPEEGCGVLIQARGYLQHVGIYCLVGGEPSVLHAASGYDQVVLQRVRDLPIRGLSVEGYYRWT